MNKYFSSLIKKAKEKRRLYFSIGAVAFFSLIANTFANDNVKVIEEQHIATPLDTLVVEAKKDTTTPKGKENDFAFVSGSWIAKLNNKKAEICSKINDQIEAYNRTLRKDLEHAKVDLEDVGNVAAYLSQTGYKEQKDFFGDENIVIIEKNARALNGNSLLKKLYEPLKAKIKELLSKSSLYLAEIKNLYNSGEAFAKFPHSEEQEGILDEINRKTISDTKDYEPPRLLLPQQNSVLENMADYKERTKVYSDSLNEYSERMIKEMEEEQNKLGAVISKKEEPAYENIKTKAGYLSRKLKNAENAGLSVNPEHYQRLNKLTNGLAGKK